jgi:hypothetical protein
LISCHSSMLSVCNLQFFIELSGLNRQLEKCLRVMAHLTLLPVMWKYGEIVWTSSSFVDLGLRKFKGQ